MMKKLLNLIFLLFVYLISFYAYAGHNAHHLWYRRNHHKTTYRHITVNVIKKDIMREYYKWKGVKYRWGGNSKNEIDCSALMQRFFRETHLFTLPRTTLGQINYGHRIQKRRLKPGDLIFFNIKKNVRHVGVYIGHNKFVNSAKSKGVTISDLRNCYWRAHYYTARRILSY
ncbi:TPA: NlpC/P60 family protein [Klebsiella aerogenes]